MKTFLQYAAALCTGLLSWWQLDLRGDSGMAGFVLVGLGVVTAYMTIRGYRIGYWFGVILGLSYGAEVGLQLGADAVLRAVSAVLGSSLAVLVCSVALLRMSRERTKRRPKYERPW